MYIYDVDINQNNVIEKALSDIYNNYSEEPDMNFPLLCAFYDKNENIIYIRDYSNVSDFKTMIKDKAWIYKEVSHIRILILAENDCNRIIDIHKYLDVKQYNECGKSQKTDMVIKAMREAVHDTATLMVSDFGIEPKRNRRYSNYYSIDSYTDLVQKVNLCSLAGLLAVLYKESRFEKFRLHMIINNFLTDNNGNITLRVCAIRKKSEPVASDIKALRNIIGNGSFDITSIYNELYNAMDKQKSLILGPMEIMRLQGKRNR